jgi:hypothetical protein
MRSGAKLKVTYPPSLIKKLGEGNGMVKASLANFGHI